MAAEKRRAESPPPTAPAVKRIKKEEPEDDGPPPLLPLTNEDVASVAPVVARGNLTHLYARRLLYSDFQCFLNILGDMDNTSLWNSDFIRKMDHGFRVQKGIYLLMYDYQGQKYLHLVIEEIDQIIFFAKKKITDQAHEQFLDIFEKTKITAHVMDPLDFAHLAVFKNCDFNGVTWNPPPFHKRSLFTEIQGVRLTHGVWRDWLSKSGPFLTSVMKQATECLQYGTKVVMILCRCEGFPYLILVRQEENWNKVFRDPVVEATYLRCVALFNTALPASVKLAENPLRYLLSSL